MLNAWAISVFFLRFWSTTRDRLFGCFAGAFLLLGFERIAMRAFADEFRFYVYLIRLGAFLLILFAIWEKNRRGRNREIGR